MAYLITSLRHIFNELDLTWPNRAHRLDGWIGDIHHCPGNSDHCADSAGRVHAIDIDKNGIDADWVVGRISNVDNVVRYINWNGFQYHARNDFRPMPITTGDKHTSHIHVSAEHTDYARNYAGGWGIFTPYPVPAIQIPDISVTPQDQWDHASLVFNVADEFALAGGIFAQYASGLASVRG